MADLPSLLDSVRQLGLEGVIAKRADSPYVSRRAETWLKLKVQQRQEFVIGGFIDREASVAEVGSLLLGYYDGGVLQYAGKFNAKKLRYVENTGALFRIGKDGSKHEVVTHMMFPTALEFDKNGVLYSTNFGNEANHGEGQVLKIVPGDTTAVSPKVPEPKVHGSYDVPKSNKTFAGGSVAGAAKLTIVEPKNVVKWGFAPKALTVKVGQKIVVTNSGRISHTATSVTGAFDTGLIKHLRSAVFSVDKPGTYKFICSPHPWMKGTLIVTGASKATGGKKAAAGPTVKSPSLNTSAVIAVVGLILVGIFGLAWLARRRPEQT